MLYARLFLQLHCSEDVCLANDIHTCFYFVDVRGYGHKLSVDTLCLVARARFIVDMRFSEQEKCKYCVNRITLHFFLCLCLLLFITKQF